MEKLRKPDTKLMPLWLRVLLLIFGSCAWAFCIPSSVMSQVQDFEVVIGLPNEGETFYAGPSSLLYNIPVSGWILGYESDPTQISLLLEVIKDGEVIGELNNKPLLDSTFEFKVTVNPEHSWGRFDRTDGAYDPTKLSCGECCHHPTQLHLVSGDVFFRVTAISPNGDRSVAKRRITVDLSDVATVPVQITLEGKPEAGLDGITVIGTTRLYLWRSRLARGITDQNGRVQMRIEALSESPTQYTFEVKPVIVDGVLYASNETVTLTLPPGAKTGPQITLSLKSRSGLIGGTLLGADLPKKTNLQVWAINLPEGDHRKMLLNPQGQFEFSNIPLDEYLLTLDRGTLAHDGFLTKPVYLNLSTQVEVSVQIPVMRLEGALVSGKVLDTSGNQLPFAWIVDSNRSAVIQVIPHSGAYMLDNLPVAQTTLIASAPGYYSQARRINLSSGSNMPLDFALTKKPNLRQLDWGGGSIFIPAESLVEMQEGLLSLTKGWIWGQGISDKEIQIRTPTANIFLSQGSFALDFYPGQEAWLYLINGQARIQSSGRLQEISLMAGQMLNLLAQGELIPVSYDPVVIDALRRGRVAPVEPVWQPTPSTQIRYWLERIGIGMAQLITFGTYIIVLLSIISTPFMFIYYWKKHKRTDKSH